MTTIGRVAIATQLVRATDGIDCFVRRILELSNHINLVTVFLLLLKYIGCFAMQCILLMHLHS